MNLLNKVLRCSHRHTIDEHPGCFQAGNINQKTASDIYAKNGKPWYQVEGTKVGYIDIETDNLTANFGTMLSWCIKTKDGDTAYDVITKEELFNGVVDKRITDSLVKEMLKYKIIVSYYGTKFDIPFVRSKAMFHNLYFPAYIREEHETRTGNIVYKSIPQLIHFDLYYSVKMKMKLSSNSLATACDYLGIEGKTPLKGSTWRKAKYGDPKALAEVLEHNIGDVEILEQLHNRLEPFAAWLKKPL